jgi:hypothetical protein
MIWTNIQRPTQIDCKEGIMEKTWAPTVAGILDIVAGVMSLIGCLVLAILGSAAHHAFQHYVRCEDVFLPCSPGVLFSGLSLMLLVFGVLSLVGGIFAVQRRNWAWALVGSIAAIFCFFPLGVVAVILVVMAEKEFIGRSTDASV